MQPFTHLAARTSVALAASPDGGARSPQRHHLARGDRRHSKRPCGGGPREPVSFQRCPVPPRVGLGCSVAERSEEPSGEVAVPSTRQSSEGDRSRREAQEWS